MEDNKAMAYPQGFGFGQARGGIISCGLERTRPGAESIILFQKGPEPGRDVFRPCRKGQDRGGAVLGKH